MNTCIHALELLEEGFKSDTQRKAMFANMKGKAAQGARPSGRRKREVEDEPDADYRPSSYGGLPGRPGEGTLYTRFGSVDYDSESERRSMKKELETPGSELRKFVANELRHSRNYMKSYGGTAGRDSNSYGAKNSGGAPEREEFYNYYGGMARKDSSPTNSSSRPKGTRRVEDEPAGGPYGNMFSRGEGTLYTRFGSTDYDSPEEREKKKKQLQTPGSKLRKEVAQELRYERARAKAYGYGSHANW